MYEAFYGFKERPFALVTIYQHDCQHEFVLLVEPVEDFVARHCDSAGTFGAAFDFDVARGWQLAVYGLGLTGHVPAPLVGRNVCYRMAEGALHHRARFEIAIAADAIEFLAHRQGKPVIEIVQVEYRLHGLRAAPF